MRHRQRRQSLNLGFPGSKPWSPSPTLRCFTESTQAPHPAIPVENGAPASPPPRAWTLGVPSRMQRGEKLGFAMLVASLWGPALPTVTLCLGPQWVAAWISRSLWNC